MTATALNQGRGMPLRPWSSSTPKGRIWCYEIELPHCCRMSAMRHSRLGKDYFFWCGDCGRRWRPGKVGKEVVGGVFS